MSIWIVSAILLTTLILLISEKIQVDLIAIGIMVVLMLTKVLSPTEAVSGFANPAVITVGAMFLIGRGMIRTGAVGFLVERVVASSSENAKLAMIVTLLMVAIASAFINNTPVVVLFIPVILSLSCEFNFSPSKYLIPISYASILGGTCTLIGTSTNIIVSDLSHAMGHGKINMFELSTLGVPIAILGIAFLYFAVPRLMPEHLSPVCELKDSKHRQYLAELAVPKNSSLVGMDPRSAFAEKYPDLEVFEVIRYSHIYYPDRDNIRIAPDDLLLVKGSPTNLFELLQSKMVHLPPSEKDLKFVMSEKESLIIELIIPPQSSLLGERLKHTGLKRNPDIHIIAIKRSSLHYTEQKIHDIKLRVGDILLVRCPEDKLEGIRGQPDFIIIEDVHHEIIQKRKAWQAFLIFAGLVTAASTGLADIMVCALAGVFLMILTGCLQLRDAYRTLQGSVLLLIAGTIALGIAMEKTGTSKFYAEAFLRLFHGLGPGFVLSAFLLLTSISTQILSNSATAILLLPIAISSAIGLDVDPKPFIIAVCFGASACFATPIGYQTNLLVYGPGGYRFSDYMKLGIPLNLLVLTIGSFFIPVIWPF